MKQNATTAFQEIVVGKTAGARKNLAGVTTLMLLALMQAVNGILAGVIASKLHQLVVMILTKQHVQMPLTMLPVDGINGVIIVQKKAVGIYRTMQAVHHQIFQ